MADVKKDWIDKANLMLRKNPNMSKQEVINSLKKQGLDRPTGIEGKGPRRFGPKSRSVGGRSRRKTQEQVSTQQSAEFTKKQRQLMSEDVGIAQHAGMEEPFFEHKYSQDVSGLLEEGAPGDYVDRFPEQSSAFKTEAERINRQNYRNRFAILTTPTGFRAVPREYFSELADPFSLPGIDLDETVSIKKQLDQGFSNLKFGKGAVRFLSKVPMLGGVLAAGTTLASGGSPAQAFGAAVEAENPIENLSAGPLFDESQDFGTVLEQSRMQNQIPLMTRIENGALKMFFPQQVRGRSGAKRAQDAL